MPTVLVIDDNVAVSTALDVLFSLRDVRTISAETPDAGLALLAREHVDVVIQDMNFRADTTSGEDGVALFKEIRKRHPELPVILMTAWTHLEAAVELVKGGAADYLAKPWDDTKLVATVHNLLELSATRQELARRRADENRRRAELERNFDLRDVVFADPAMERCIALACQVARADVPVLITGPNGAGKEKIAEIVQANSSVKTGPFVTLNCGALPSELIEAELFGAEAGAYTGAQRAREGKFESADGGTLFLDEIGNLSSTGQMKLLRVLETGRFERLGSNKEVQVKVRVISATNADLRAMIRANTFREDLYYRLNTIEIRVPPLADRVDDILPIAQSFLVGDKKLSVEARDALRRHSWPGNVRELKNAIQRASLLAQGPEITTADLHIAKPQAPTAEGSAESIDKSGGRPGRSAAEGNAESIDKGAIEAALSRANGVIAQAAAELGLSRQALYRRMDKLSIPRD